MHLHDIATFINDIAPFISDIAAFINDIAASINDIAAFIKDRCSCMKMVKYLKVHLNAQIYACRWICDFSSSLKIN